MTKVSTALVASAAALVALAPSAVAAKSAAVGTCKVPVLAQVFAPWGDANLYGLAPGGDFETTGNGWTVTGAAGIVRDAENSLGGRDRWAAEIGRGVTLTSPPVCVNKSFPLFRFFASGTAGSLRVDVVYPDGSVRTEATLPATGGWALTPQIRMASGQLGVADGQLTTVRIRITAQDASWRIDDVHVDPRMR